MADTWNYPSFYVRQIVCKVYRMKIKASNNSSQEAIAKCWTLSIPDKQEL